LMGSLATALGTLPMPPTMPREEEFGIEWTGKRLGNTQTCDAQGFFYVFGRIAMFLYNGMLCLYYACAIAFQMKERNLRKYVEPALHLIPIALGLGTAVPPLFLEMYNPSPSDRWCTLIPYPPVCFLPAFDCIRRSSLHAFEIYRIETICLIAIDTAIIIVSLALVLWRTVTTDRDIALLKREHTNETSGPLRDRQQHSKVILIQALAYIAACVLTTTFTTLKLLGNQSVVIDVLRSTFSPLQGFFNLVIFLCHKVYNYRRVHPETSICNVLVLLFRTSVQEPVFVSRITIVERTAGECKVLDIYVEDEGGSISLDDEFSPDVSRRRSSIRFSIPPSHVSGRYSPGIDVLVDESDSRDGLSVFDDSKCLHESVAKSYETSEFDNLGNLSATGMSIGTSLP